MNTYTEQRRPEGNTAGPSQEQRRDTPPAVGGEGRKDLLLRSTEFRKGREQGWRALEDMLGRIDAKGIACLSATEVQELPLLYRSAMSSLSVARGIVLDRNLLLYLENLSLRAYLAVYGPRTGMLQNMSAFFSTDFPRYVRSIGPHLLIASLALVIGAVSGFLLVNADMSFFHMLVPEDLAGGRGPSSTAEELRATELFAPWPGFVQTFIVFANSLFRHNTVIGIFCFGLGFALGLPTILLLLYNGMVLGAFLALHAARGLTVDFIGWLSIHGVTEILAILLCGAAGLLVAEKIIFPGPLSRLASLAEYGRKAAGVACGAVLLFFVAGILEGGFRQLINHTPGRYAFALATAALWLAYFTRAGKK